MSVQKSRRKKPERKRNSTSSIVGIFLFIVIVVIAVGSVYYGLMPTGQQSQTGTSVNGLPAGDPTLTTCVSDSPGNVLISFKVNIRIILSGVEFKMPAKIGEEAGCTRPLHTLDTSGTVYVTSPVNYPYTLQDFFAVWGQVFTRNQIFTLHTDSNHHIVLTVNGKVNNEYENYILTDGDQIVITFT